MNQSSRSITVVHTDSFNSGPHLYITDKHEAEIGEERYNLNFAVCGNFYRVCHLILGYGDSQIKYLREFTNLQDAISYSMQQYTHYTGNCPFITTGLTGGYKSTGDRNLIKMDPDIECELEEIENDEVDYIVIINDKHFEAHSLNPFAEW